MVPPICSFSDFLWFVEEGYVLNIIVSSLEPSLVLAFDDFKNTACELGLRYMI